jgi:hypothetical protein
MLSAVPKKSKELPETFSYLETTSSEKVGSKDNK